MDQLSYQLAQQGDYTNNSVTGEMAMLHQLSEVGADRGKLPTSALPPSLAQTAKCAIG
jgi:hypothetical protein